MCFEMEHVLEDSIYLSICMCALTIHLKETEGFFSGLDISLSLTALEIGKANVRVRMIDRLKTGKFSFSDISF